MIDFVILLLMFAIFVNLVLNAAKLWNDLKERKK